MLLGLESLGGRVMPDLVHRLIRLNGGLAASSDCITRPFWFPLGSAVVTTSVAEIELMSRVMTTTTSRPVSIFSSRYNLNPVIEVRRRY
jgi:hypothetical protein